jgi:carboxyl-terminal processing protease
LKKSFKTTSGRTVYDGGGIDPDVKIQAVEAHALTQVLFEKGYIFDFATQYVYLHPQAVDARNFSLTDAEYQQFISWMKDKNYTYKSYLEFGLQQVTEQAKKEKYYNDLKTQLEQINAKIVESKKNELTLYKDQIRMLIEEEIVSRYFLEKGGIETGFKYDEEVKKAVEILHNKPQYKKILNLQ